MASGIYKIDIDFKNSHELLMKFLMIYSVANNVKDKENYLRKRHAEVLGYYALKGYSSETKNLILESLPTLNREHLNQINSELQKKKYLHKDKYNSNVRSVDQSIIVLSQYLKDTDSPILAVKFVKDNG